LAAVEKPLEYSKYPGLPLFPTHAFAHVGSELQKVEFLFPAMM